MKAIDLYDFLCDILDRYVEQFNPCEINMIEGKTTCMGELDKCCEDCDHLGPDGCKIQCLGCKLYICFALQKKDPVFKDIAAAVKMVAKKYHLIAMRTPKEELFKINN